jgi:hypothetical protein
MRNLIANLIADLAGAMSPYGVKRCHKGWPPPPRMRFEDWAATVPRVVHYDAQLLTASHYIDDRLWWQQGEQLAKDAALTKLFEALKSSYIDSTLDLDPITGRYQATVSLRVATRRNQS